MSYNPYSAAEVDNNVHNRNQLHQPQPERAFVPPQQYQQPHQLQQPQQPQQPQQQYGQQYSQQFQQPQFNQYQQPPQQQFQPQQQGAQPFDQFASFMGGNPAAAMGLQAGQAAMANTQHYVQQELNKYVPAGTIKYYFKVSNSYVLSKLLLILFPFTNQRWERSERRPDESSGNDPSAVVAEGFAFPVDDKNAPDFYIPLMGLISYILLCAMLAGLKGEFHPQVFGLQTSSTLAYQLIDLAILKGGLYMLNVSSNTYDLIAYSGYKFVPIIIILLMNSISPVAGLNWFVFFYMVAAFGFFELRAIRFNLFAGTHNSAHTMRNRTNKSSNYFLLIYSFILQGLLLWGLTTA